MFDFYAQGFFSWAVINSDDRIVRYSRGKKKNLILNQGLDGIAVRSWAESFKVCAVGTGANAPASSQTGLSEEVKRTQLYLDMENACSAELVDNKFLLKRTFVFSPEGTPIIYREAGFSHSTSVGGNLFSKIALPLVSVDAGERLIIQYELLLSLEPITSVALTNPVLNRTSSGLFQFQNIGLAGINSVGETIHFDEALSCNEPSASAKGFLSINSSPPAGFPTAEDRTGTTFEKDLTLSSYVAGTYTREKILTTTKSEAAGSWSSCGVGSSAGNSFANTGLVYVFNAPLVKASGILSLHFRYRWSIVTKENFSTLLYWLDEEKPFLKQNPILLYFRLSE